MNFTHSTMLPLQKLRKCLLNFERYQVDHLVHGHARLLPLCRVTRGRATTCHALFLRLAVERRGACEEGEGK